MTDLFDNYRPTEDYDTDDFVSVPDEIRPDNCDSINTESADEFGYTPNEYIPDYCDESDEQAATTDSSDCGGSNRSSSDCGNSDCGDCSDSETGEDASALFSDESDCFDASDEQAATVDNWYNSETTAAQQKCKLDDYEIISDVLGSEKQLVKLYSTALCEAAEEPLRDIIREGISSAASDQYRAFEYMQKRGMYKTEQAEEEDIWQARDNFGPLCDNNNCGCTKNNNCGCDK